MRDYNEMLNFVVENINNCSDKFGGIYVPELENLYTRVLAATLRNKFNLPAYNGGTNSKRIYIGKYEFRGDVTPQEAEQLVKKYIARFDSFEDCKVYSIYKQYLEYVYPERDKGTIFARDTEDAISLILLAQGLKNHENRADVLDLKKQLGDSKKIMIGSVEFTERKNANHKIKASSEIWAEMERLKNLFKQNI